MSIDSQYSKNRQVRIIPGNVACPLCFTIIVLNCFCIWLLLYIPINLIMCACWPEILLWVNLNEENKGIWRDFSEFVKYIHAVEKITGIYNENIFQNL